MIGHWFIGVVENTKDPLELGRLQVRALGYHNENLLELPVADLPWCTCMVPLSQSGIGGIGSSLGITEGTWVVGFFTDSKDIQDAIIMGSLPGFSAKKQASDINPNAGFRDPNNVFPILNQADIPSVARSTFITAPSFLSKVSSRLTEVPQAVPPFIGTVDSATDASDPKYDPTQHIWNMPDAKLTNSPIYPLNRAHSTISGHTQEFDDTPGKERISTWHSSGSYTEFQATGDQVNVIQGNKYTLIIKDDNIIIQGNANITIQGDLRTLVKGDHHLEVDGDYTQNIKGSIKTKVGLNNLTEIGQDRATNITGKDSTLVGEDLALTVNGNSDVTVSGTADTTVVGKTTLIALGNLDITSGSTIKMVSPDQIKMFSDRFDLWHNDTPFNPFVGVPPGLTIFGGDMELYNSLFTGGDTVSYIRGDSVSLARHRHSSHGQHFPIPGWPASIDDPDTAE